MSDELNQAIGVIKSGDKLTGRRLLIEALRQNPDDETAWIWMTQVIDSVEGRIWCLQNALEVNPDSAPARQGLAELQEMQARRAEQTEQRSRQEQEQLTDEQAKAFGLKPVMIAGLMAILLLGVAGVVGTFVSRLSSTAAADVSSTATRVAPTAGPTPAMHPTAQSTPTVPPNPSSVPTARPTQKAATPPTPLPTSLATTVASHSPPPAVDGSKILYLARPVQYESSQVRLVNPDGSEPVVLGDFAGEDTHLLDWSQDGQWILASNAKDGTFVLHADGSGETVSLSAQTASFGTWSPAASQAAFITQEGLFLGDLDKREARVLSLTAVPAQGAQVSGVSWSPGGDWLAFQTVATDPDNKLTTGILYRYDIFTGELQELYKSRQVAFSAYNTFHPHSLPVVSPDGETILTNLFAPPNLSTIPATGGSPAVFLRTTSPAVEPPRWSPDGQWLAVPYRQDIYVVSLDGKQARNLTRTPNLIERQVTWSPDGQYLACSIETVISGRDLALYDLQTGQQMRLTADAGQWSETDDLSPIWSAPLPAEQLAQLAEAGPAVSLSPPTLGPGQRAVPTPMAPEPDRSLESPPPAMDPPWWNARYFYRIPLHLNTSIPISYDASGLGYPPLVQVAFDPARIRDQLYYPIQGYDLHVAWWGGAEEGWVQLPCDIQGLDSSQALLTFPLQESMDAYSDAYYIYYGSFAPLQRWEAADGLYELHYSATEGGTKRFYSASLQFLTPGKDLPGEQEGQVVWSNNHYTRLVADLDATQSLGLSARLSNHVQGSLSLFVRPTKSDRTGVLLSTIDDTTTGEASNPAPLLTYEEGGLHFLIGGRWFTAPIALQGGRWYNITIVWLAGDQIQWFVNGRLSSENPYNPKSTTATPPPRLQLGTTNAQAGLAGQYFNVYSFFNTLTPGEVRNLYRAQWLVTASMPKTATAAFTTASISPDRGGILRSPDGRTWVEFPPGAVDGSIVVSFVAVNRGETQPDHLARFDLVPFNWNGHMDDLDDMSMDEYQSLLDVPLRAPIAIYYRYAPDYVERPESITYFWFSDAEEQWLPSNLLLNTEETIAIGTDVNHWGSYTIAKNYGLGGPPRIP